MTSNVVIIGTWLELEEIWALDQGNTSSSMTLGNRNKSRKWNINWGSGWGNTKLDDAKWLDESCLRLWELIGDLVDKIGNTNLYDI